MADNLAQFRECTSSEWGNFSPDENTFYRVKNENENTYDVYLGGIQLNTTFSEEEPDPEPEEEENTIITMIGAIPFYYEREYLFTPNKTSINIHANTQINIDNKGYILTNEVILSTDNIAEAGKDIYIYACQPEEESTEPTFVLSQNSTVPSGYNADNSRKIGGFHCLCMDINGINGHLLDGYSAGDILPASVWDLKHRPISNPEGMVYDEGTGKWYDIYPNSWNGSKLVSEYNEIIITGVTSNPQHGYGFKEALGQIGKRLPWRHEFEVIAQGANEGTPIQGEENAVLAGGHIDTQGQRMVSNIGLEDCCGAIYQWVNDEFEDYGLGTESSHSHAYWHTSDGHRYMSNYGWADNLVTYHGNIDNQYHGNTYGFPRQGLVGGNGTAGSHCGTRCLITSDFGSCQSANFGARGVSERA